MSLFTLLVLAIVPQTSDLVIAVDRLHTGDGTSIESAVLTLRGGKIASVVSGEAPEGALYIPSAECTPGLIDAFSFAGVTSSSVEQSSEVSTHRLADTLFLADPAFGRALSQGVTSAYLSPDSWNMIGGLGAFVKTAGGAPESLFADSSDAIAVVLNPEAALKICLGIDSVQRNRRPSGRWTTSFLARRPTTRMGATWTVRRSFYEALSYKKARQAGQIDLDPKLEPFVAVLEGRIPVRIQARVANDIQTALRIQQEFEIPYLILEEATEAWSIASYLGKLGVPIVLGPAFDSQQRSMQSTPAALEAWRSTMVPTPACCEHLDEEGLPHEHEGGFDAELGVWRPRGLALDLMMLATTPDSLANGFYQGRQSFRLKPSPAQASLLHEADVPIALSSVEAHQAPHTESSLIHQARMAVRWGLDSADALPLVTSQAAALCGMSDRLGQLRPGFDADLVLWSGDPLDETSRPLLVVLDGTIQVDNR